MVKGQKYSESTENKTVYKEKEGKSLKEKNVEKSKEEHPQISNLAGPQLEKNLVRFTIEVDKDGKPVIKRSE